MYTGGQGGAGVANGGQGNGGIGGNGARVVAAAVLG